MGTRVSELDPSLDSQPVQAKVTSQPKPITDEEILDECGNVISKDVQTKTLKGDKEFDNSKTKDAAIPAAKEVVTSDNKVTSITDIVRPSDNVKVTVLRGRNLEKQKLASQIHMSSSHTESRWRSRRLSRAT